MKKIQELVQSLTGKSTKMVKVGKWMVAKEAYDFIVNEQKAIDDKYIKLLEEDRNAFIAFCHNIINGMYISVIDAAKEQLGYLENKVMD